MKLQMGIASGKNNQMMIKKELIFSSYEIKDIIEAIQTFVMSTSLMSKKNIFFFFGTIGTVL